jgi:hypothetical protein
MLASKNLSDPEYEPSDEELRDLSRAAFAHLASARRESEAKLLDEIARLRAEALRRLHEQVASAR